MRFGATGLLVPAVGIGDALRDMGETRGGDRNSPHQQLSHVSTVEPSARV